MRVGRFTLPVWRFDLAGIDHAEQRPLMTQLAQCVEAGPGEGEEQITRRLKAGGATQAPAF